MKRVDGPGDCFALANGDFCEVRPTTEIGFSDDQGASFSLVLCADHAMVLRADKTLAEIREMKAVVERARAIVDGDQSPDLRSTAVRFSESETAMILRAFALASARGES